MDFETKLAAAGETLEKLAAERGLSLNDFTEQETVDLLTTIMGDKEAANMDESILARGAEAGRPIEGMTRATLGALAGAGAGGVAGAGLGGALGYGLGHMGGYGGLGARLGAGVGGIAGIGAGGHLGADVATRGLGDMANQQKMLALLQAQQEAAGAKEASAELTYGQVMHEVAKVAAANGYDISQASPAELDDAVQKMATLLSNPEYLTKQAALQEKIAEADAMGRVMAHAYVDELGKLAAAEQEKSEEDEKEDEKEKAEKKASFYRSVKSAGEMPAALKEHMKKKDDEEDEDEEEKKASFAKAASLRAAAPL